MQAAEIATIVQAVSGVYCAFICTFAWLFPRHPPTKAVQSWRFGPVSGLRLAALIGIVVFVLSLAAPAFYRLIAPWQATGALLLVMILIVAIVLRQRGKTGQNSDSSEFPKDGVALATRKTFDSLSVSQRCLIKHIYNHPTTSAAFLTTAITELGFPSRVGAESLNRVLATNLVVRDARGNVDPNPSIRNIVEHLLEMEPWPSLEVIKSINKETATAVASDCRLGQEAAVAELDGKHSSELATVRNELAEKTKILSDREAIEKKMLNC